MTEPTTEAGNVAMTLIDRLESAAYRNGKTDTEDRWSDKKYREVYEACRAAKQQLQEHCASSEAVLAQTKAALADAQEATDDLQTESQELRVANAALLKRCEDLDSRLDGALAREDVLIETEARLLKRCEELEAKAMFASVYKPCDKHAGQPWPVMYASPSTTIVREVCPHCAALESAKEGK